MSHRPERGRRLKKMTSGVPACATAVASLAGAVPGAAATPPGPDRHVNCTAGFAAGSAHDGCPRAVGSSRTGAPAASPWVARARPLSPTLPSRPTLARRLAGPA